MKPKQLDDHRLQPAILLQDVVNLDVTPQTFKSEKVTNLQVKIQQKIQTDIAVMRKVPVLRNLYYFEIKRLCNISIEMKYSQGDLIFQQDESVNGFIYILKEGEFTINKKFQLPNPFNPLQPVGYTEYENDRIVLKSKQLEIQRLETFPSKREKQFQVQQLSLFELFGEEAYENNQQTRNYSVQCESNQGIVWKIHYQEFIQIIHANHKTAEAFKNHVQSKQVVWKELIENIELQLIQFNDFMSQSMKPVQQTKSTQRVVLDDLQLHQLKRSQLKSQKGSRASLFDEQNEDSQRSFRMMPMELQIKRCSTGIKTKNRYFVDKATESNNSGLPQGSISPFHPDYAQYAGQDKVSTSYLQTESPQFTNRSSNFKLSTAQSNRKSSADNIVSVMRTEEDVQRINKEREILRGKILNQPSTAMYPNRKVISLKNQMIDFPISNNKSIFDQLEVHKQKPDTAQRRHQSQYEKEDQKLVVSGIGNQVKNVEKIIQREIQKQMSSQSAHQSTEQQIEENLQVSRKPTANDPLTKNFHSELVRRFLAKSQLNSLINLKNHIKKELVDTVNVANEIQKLPENMQSQYKLEIQGFGKLTAEELKQKKRAALTNKSSRSCRDLALKWVQSGQFFDQVVEQKKTPQKNLRGFSIKSFFPTKSSNQSEHFSQQMPIEQKVEDHQQMITDTYQRFNQNQQQARMNTENLSSEVGQESIKKSIYLKQNYSSSHNNSNCRSSDSNKQKEINPFSNRFSSLHNGNSSNLPLKTMNSQLQQSENSQNSIISQGKGNFFKVIFGEQIDFSNQQRKSVDSLDSNKLNQKQKISYVTCLQVDREHQTEFEDGENYVQLPINGSQRNSFDSINQFSHFQYGFDSIQQQLVNDEIYRDILHSQIAKSTLYSGKTSSKKHPIYSKLSNLN